MPPLTGNLGSKASRLGRLVPGSPPGLADSLNVIPNLIRHWRCDEASGPALLDATLTENLTLQSGSGTALFAQLGPDGENCVKIPVSPTGPFFMASAGGSALTTGAYYFWYKPTDKTQEGILFGQTDSTGLYNGVTLSVSTNTQGGTAGWVVCADVGGGSRLYSSVGLVNGEWYEIYLEWSSTHSSLSINGGLASVISGFGADLAGVSGHSPFYFSLGGVPRSTDLGFFPSTNGCFANVMVFSAPPGKSIISPGTSGSIQGTSTPNGGPLYTVSTGNLRDTKTLAEVPLNGDPNCLITKAVAESLRTGNFHLRTTKTLVEVLRSTATYNPVSVSATTNFTLTATATEFRGGPISVSASSAFVMTATSSSRVGHPLLVSASSGLTLSSSARGYVPAVHVVSARSDMTVSANGSFVVHNPTNYVVSATTHLSLSASASLGDARSLMVSASTAFILASAAYSPRSLLASARSSFVLTGTGACRSTAIYVDAFTSFLLTASAKKPYVFGPRFVSAATSFSFSQIAKFTNPGPRFVSAATNFSLATTSTFTRSAILFVSATSGLMISGTGSESASFGVSASGGLSLTGSGRQNRNISASATTNLGLSNAPLTNNLKPVAATSHMAFTVSAGLILTGTEAKSGIAFTDLAQAVVWIPWRRTSLTLPAGGNLPHS